MVSLTYLLLAFGIMVAAVVLIIGRTRQVSARDVAWLAGGPGSPSAEADVYARYLQRHRRHRLAGGLFGLVFAVLVGARFYGSVGLGVGQASPLADVLFCSLAGVLIGALSAESFRLSEPASSTVSASLAERAGASRPDLIRLARGLCLASLVGAGLVAATGNGFAPLWIAVGGLIAMIIAEATQAAISGRRRPVLSDRAQVVDLRMRSFASTSVARLQLAAAVLASAWTLSKVPGGETGPVAVVEVLAVTGGLVITLVQLHRAAPRPPRKWIVESS